MVVYECIITPEPIRPAINWRIHIQYIMPFGQFFCNTRRGRFPVCEDTLQTDEYEVKLFVVSIIHKGYQSSKLLNMWSMRALRSGSRSAILSTTASRSS